MTAVRSGGFEADERNADIDGMEMINHPDEIFTQAVVLQRKLAWVVPAGTL